MDRFDLLRGLFLATAVLTGAACSMRDLGYLEHRRTDTSILAAEATTGVPEDDDDFAAVPDAATAPEVSRPVLAIQCSDAPTGYCSAPGEVCCAGRGRAGKSLCYPADVGCPRADDVFATCDDTSDCTNTGRGAACCQTGKSAVCTSLSECALFEGHFVICDPTAASPCPNGATCEGTGNVARCVGL